MTGVIDIRTTAPIRFRNRLAIVAVSLVCLLVPLAYFGVLGSQYEGGSRFHRRYVNSLLEGDVGIVGYMPTEKIIIMRDVDPSAPLDVATGKRVVRRLGEIQYRFLLGDLLSPFLYGLALLIAHRTLLLARPRYVTHRVAWEVWGYLLPLAVACMSDVLENTLFLYCASAMTGKSRPTSDVALTILPWVTAAKTWALVVTVASLGTLMLLVLQRGDRAIEVRE